MAEASKRFLSSPKVKERYGDISSPTLNGWLDDPELDFPKPTVINGIRYFAEDELDAFDRRRREQPHYGPRGRPEPPKVRGRPRKRPEDQVQAAE